MIYIPKKYVRLVFIPLFIVLACQEDINKAYDYRVSYNPYSDVRWETWHKCLSQHHDHTRAIEQRVRSYDSSGYNAVVILHYAGVKSLTYTMQERLWPFSNYLDHFDTDEEFLATTKNLKILIPSMEEVGTHHMTSAFLTSYIAFWEPNLYSWKENWHYESSQECIDLINELGGYPIIAHPTKDKNVYANLRNYQGMEIYNAFYANKLRQEKYKKDKNDHFMSVWDHVLKQYSTKIWGFAVNDWSGPFNNDHPDIYPEVYDSGKTLVMVEEFTLKHYRSSLQQGAFFAIKDQGIEKGLFPEILQIIVSQNKITIIANSGTISWVSVGNLVHVGNILELTNIPYNIDYVRAEIRNNSGTVYSQPFTVSKVVYN